MNSNILDLAENEIAFIRFRYPHIDPDDLLSYAPGMQTLRNIDILETLSSLYNDVFSISFFLLSLKYI